MHRVIYIDILFCVNFIIDFMLLLSVRKFLSLKARYRRMVLGSLVGAISSFVIFLPPMNEFLSLIIRLVTAFAVVFTTFFPTSRKSFLKAVSAYFLITFCFCGACIAFFMLFSPPVAIRNGAVYIDISPIMLVGIILACYIIIRIICRVSGRSLASQEICWLVVENNEKSVKLIAKTDTGNMLKEPFSNLPVIVAEREKLEVVLPSEISDYLAKTVSVSDTSCDYVSGIRLVPYNSVGGEGLLPAFKPDTIKVILNGKNIESEAYIAVTSRRLSESFSAIIPSEIILN